MYKKKVRIPGFLMHSHKCANSFVLYNLINMSSMDVPLMGFYVPCIYLHAGWRYCRWLWSLLLCPLSVECYCLPLFVDSTQSLKATFCVSLQFTPRLTRKCVPILNKSLFCYMHVHTCVTKCPVNGGYVCHWEVSFSWVLRLAPLKWTQF